MTSTHVPSPAASTEPREHPLTIPMSITLLLGGVVLGLFGGFLQAYTVPLAGVDVPVGLIFVLATVFACLRAVIHLFDKRRAGVLVLVGWLVATVALALPGPGGDIAIGANALALIYLFGGVIAGTAIVNVPAHLRPSQATDPPAAEDTAAGGGGFAAGSSDRQETIGSGQASGTAPSRTDALSDTSEEETRHD